MNATLVNHSEERGVHVVGFPLNERGQANPDLVRRYFAEDFLEDTREVQRLLLDLSGVLTLDSASLSPMVKRLRELQTGGGAMGLCGIQSAGLREIFALTRFDKIFPIFTTREDALKRLAA